jgi:hypothetical protein
MKKLFDEKGHLMVKYIINQIAMSIFGVMIATTAMALGDSWLLPFGIFALLFYYFILITFIREDGLKDAIKVDGGRMKKDRFSALKYCTIAAVPGLLFALLNIVFQAIGATTGPLASLSGIFNVFTRIFIYGMYTGIDSYLFNSEIGIFWNAFHVSSLGITYLIYTVLTLIVAHLAYSSGLNQLFVSEKKTK